MPSAILSSSFHYSRPLGEVVFAGVHTSRFKMSDSKTRKKKQKSSISATHTEATQDTAVSDYATPEATGMGDGHDDTTEAKTCNEPSEAMASTSASQDVLTELLGHMSQLVAQSHANQATMANFFASHGQQDIDNGQRGRSRKRRFTSPVSPTRSRRRSPETPRRKSPRSDNNTNEGESNYDYFEDSEDMFQEEFPESNTEPPKPELLEGELDAIFDDVPDHISGPVTWPVSKSSVEWLMKRIDKTLSPAQLREVQQNYLVPEDRKLAFTVQQIPASLASLIRTNTPYMRNYDRPYYKTHQVMHSALAPVIKVLELVCSSAFQPDKLPELKTQIKAALSDATHIITTASYMMAELRQARMKTMFKPEYKDILQQSKPTIQGFFGGNLVKAINESKKSVNAFRSVTKTKEGSRGYNGKKRYNYNQNNKGSSNYEDRKGGSGSKYRDQPYNQGSRDRERGKSINRSNNKSTRQ